MNSVLRDMFAEPPQDAVAELLQLEAAALWTLLDGQGYRCAIVIAAVKQDDARLCILQHDELSIAARAHIAGKLGKAVATLLEEADDD